MRWLSVSNISKLKRPENWANDIPITCLSFSKYTEVHLQMVQGCDCDQAGIDYSCDQKHSSCTWFWRCHWQIKIWRRCQSSSKLLPPWDHKSNATRHSLFHKEYHNASAFKAHNQVRYVDPWSWLALPISVLMNSESVSLEYCERLISLWLFPYASYRTCMEIVQICTQLCGNCMWSYLGGIWQPLGMIGTANLSTDEWRIIKSRILWAID